MRILLFIPVWKRPEITEICFMGVNRLRSIYRHIDPIAIISEESIKPLCDRYGIDYCFYKNAPLGEKKNFGLREALKKQWDYLIELGSDDLLKNELLDIYKPYLGHRHFLGLTSSAVINSETGGCKKTMPSSSFGLGRAISRELAFLMSESGMWSPELNKGLDNNSLFRMATFGYMETRIDTDEPVCIDIKSRVNIHSFDDIPGEKYPIEKAMSGLSDCEINSIQSLIYVEQ